MDITGQTAEERIAAVREIVGGYGAVMGYGGAYVERGQFTDAGPMMTSWHRICTKDINLLSSWAITADDIWQGILMLNRARDRYPSAEFQMRFPVTEQGIADATGAAREMRCLKATIVPTPEIIN